MKCFLTRESGTTTALHAGKTVLGVMTSEPGEGEGAQNILGSRNK